MQATTLLFTALVLFALAYRFYGLFIAKKVLHIDPIRTTPAVELSDSNDYQPTNKYILWGQHFSAIAAAGPLLGPVLAAQYGFLPGALWIIIGTILGGAVHDMVILFASVRHKGKSLSYIAGKLFGSQMEETVRIATLAILIFILAGLSIAMIKAMYNSPWSTYTVLCTIPIAIIMGIWMKMIRPNDIVGASIIGVILLAITIYTGPYIAKHPTLSALFTLSEQQCAIIIPAYGLLASILPVWFLMNPRGYLSAFLKVGTIITLAVGILTVSPFLSMPALTSYIHGNGPVINGPVFPFLFITIACGALSGFHAIICTGTTPKMVTNERDIPFVGYGAMLFEGTVAIMALISACVLLPADYFAINTPGAIFTTLGLEPVHLPAIAIKVGEQLQGRPGGAVSLAVGMAHIFSSIPIMQSLMAYWYHFAIMFEAVFILTAIDAGTRAGKYLIQEIIQAHWPQLSIAKKPIGSIAITALFSGLWGYIVYTGEIASIWPILGIANQLLATCALAIGTTFIISLNRKKYFALVTGIPALCMVPITLSASYLSITSNFIPNSNYLLTTITIFLCSILLLVIYHTVRKLFGDDNANIEQPESST
jgi:carbon starvation protein